MTLSIISFNHILRNLTMQTMNLTIPPLIIHNHLPSANNLSEFDFEVAEILFKFRLHNFMQLLRTQMWSYELKCKWK